MNFSMAFSSLTFLVLAYHPEVLKSVWRACVGLGEWHEGTECSGESGQTPSVHVAQRGNVLPAKVCQVLHNSY